MKPQKRYVPSGRRLIGPKVELTEEEYRKRIAQGQPIPQGARVKTSRPLPQRSARELRIKFHLDGSIEIPQYEGPEGRLKRARYLKTKNAAEAARLVHHQVMSVRSRIGQAKAIFDQVARMHNDIERFWGKFNANQKASFTDYFASILGRLAKNPLLLRDENKIHAAERFMTAVRLLQEGNSPGASATMRGIKNNMLNWLRKLERQLPRLERRRALVVDQKFQREARIWGAVDSLRAAFQLLKQALPDRQGALARLENAKRLLYATGWSAFRQGEKIVENTIPLVRKGDFAKARSYIADIDRKMVIAASPISSIYPDKLAEICQSRDSAFRETVLANQSVLYHDMMELWWNPKNRQKSSLILESITGISRLAESCGKAREAELIARARQALEAGNAAESAELFAQAASSLRPELAKELL